MPGPTSSKRRLRGHPRPIRAAALAIVIGTLLGACGGSGHLPVAPLPPLHPGRVGPETMFTPSVELLANPVGVLNELQRLGVDTVHVDLAWGSLAPDPGSRRRPSFDAADPAAYPAAAWTIYDTIVRDIKARGMNTILALSPPPPAWASAPGAPDPRTQPQWRPSAAEFGQFVRAAGIRYSGRYVPASATTPLPRVDFWSIWNEPNLGTNIAPQATDHSTVEVSPRYYRAMVDSAWAALQATGHGHDRILIGELGPAGETNGTGPGNFNAMAPLRFLRALYCVGSSYRPLRGEAAKRRGCPPDAAGSAAFAAAHPGLFHATAFADHPYAQGQPPDRVTPDEPDYAELATIGNLERALDTLQRVYGSKTRFPIYSTEYGYQTTPPDREAGTVGPTRAAGYLNWSEYLTWLDPRLRSYDQYLLADPPAGYFATGLRFADEAPKPGYAAFRLPIFLPVRATRIGHPLVVWGCVRPAHYAELTAHQPQTVVIQFRSASGGAFATVRTVPITGRHGYFEVRQTFAGSGAVRLAWSYPHGPEIFSRTVDITLR
ncbi:MAG: hypothetical protein ACR2MK_08095 [Solirubrobacteraceae bacterium]